MTPTQNVPEDRIQIGQLRMDWMGGSGCIPIQNLWARLPALVHWDQGRLANNRCWKPHGKGLVVALKGVSDRQKTWLALISGLLSLNCQSRWVLLVRFKRLNSVRAWEQEVNLGQIHELFETGAKWLYALHQTALIQKNAWFQRCGATRWSWSWSHLRQLDY